MKTFTVTLAIVLSSAVAMAHALTSSLTVQLHGFRAHIVVIINGKQYVANQNTVHLRGLMPGTYQIELLRPSYWGQQGLLFTGAVRVPTHASVAATITPRGMNVNAQPMHQAGASYWDAGCTATTHGGAHTTNGGFVSVLSSDPHSENLPQGYRPAVMGMQPSVFASALRSVELQSFDSDKIRVAKQVIERNGATAQQIKQFIELLSFESGRLEVAKFAYSRVADPENYFMINDVFWFSSSVRELDRYINNY